MRLRCKLTKTGSVKNLNKLFQRHQNDKRLREQSSKSFSSSESRKKFFRHELFSRTTKLTTIIGLTQNEKIFTKTHDVKAIDIVTHQKKSLDIFSWA